MSCASASAPSGPPTTSRSRRSGSRATWACRRRATRATGSPTSCARAVEDGVFFAGDSAGHCLPLTAEGIRTALYFGLACGRELRAVLDGRRTREHALRRYGAFSDSHARKYRWLLAVQRAVGRMTPSRPSPRSSVAFESRRIADWIFDHYLAIAPPSFVGDRRQRRRPPRAARPPPRSPAPRDLSDQATFRSRGPLGPGRLQRQAAGLDRAGPRDLGEQARSRDHVAGQEHAVAAIHRRTVPPRRARQVERARAAVHHLAPAPGLALAPVREADVEQPLQAQRRPGRRSRPGGSASAPGPAPRRRARSTARWWSSDRSSRPRPGRRRSTGRRDGGAGRRRGTRCVRSASSATRRPSSSRAWLSSVARITGAAGKRVDARPVSTSRPARGRGARARRPVRSSRRRHSVAVGRQAEEQAYGASPYERRRQLAGVVMERVDAGGRGEHLRRCARRCGSPPRCGSPARPGPHARAGAAPTGAAPSGGVRRIDPASAGRTPASGGPTWAGAGRARPSTARTDRPCTGRGGRGSLCRAHRCCARARRAVVGPPEAHLRAALSAGDCRDESREPPPTTRDPSRADSSSGGRRGDGHGLPLQLALLYSSSCGTQNRTSCRARALALVEIDRGGELPLHEQIERALRERIRSGALPAGMRLPSTRGTGRGAGRLARRGHRGLRPARRRGLPGDQTGRRCAWPKPYACDAPACARALAAAELPLPLPPRPARPRRLSRATAGCARCAALGASRRWTQSATATRAGSPSCAKRSPTTWGASAARPPTPSTC